MKQIVLGNSDNYEGFDSFDDDADNVSGRRKEKKAGKSERKKIKVEGRVQKKMRKQDRKDTRMTRKADRKDTNAEGRNARKDMKLNSKIEAQNAAIAEKETAIDDPNIESPEMTPEMQIKATNYLKSRKRVPESEPQDLAAQVVEERQRHVEQRWNQAADELEAEQGYTDEDLDDLTPDLDDVEDELLQEEEDTFSFNGEADNFLDPDTISTVFAIGKKGTDAYREKRFASGKKFMGKTKKQYDAAQAKKLRDNPDEDTAGESALRAVKGEAKNQGLKKAKPYIIGGIVILAITLIAVYYSGKKAS